MFTSIRRAYVYTMYSVGPLIRIFLNMKSMLSWGRTGPPQTPSQERFAQKWTTFVLYSLIGAPRSWEGSKGGRALPQESINL